MTVAAKKLIEVSVPLDAVNTEALRRKQKAPKGWPTSFHKWWAQRPLAAARAVIFSQMVDDPSARPDLFPTEESQERERERLFSLIERMVLWENTWDESTVGEMRAEIWDCWRRACADNADHPNAVELFDRDCLPPFVDPFSGSGSLPLTAQWMGMEAHASDLNPVAVLITRALIEIPPLFANRPPVNPEWQGKSEAEKALTTWTGAQGLANDVRYYARWMRDEAEGRIGHLYPTVQITNALAQARPDLLPLAGSERTVTAWLWARTVRCPNPACALETPLLSSFVLSSKAGRTWYLNPIVEGERIHFDVRPTPPSGLDFKSGYKRGMSGIFECAFCGTVTTRDYVAQQATDRGLGTVQTAVVAEGNGGRVFLPAEFSPVPVDVPEFDPSCLEIDLAPNPRDVWCRNFGFIRPVDLFTPRQGLAMATFSDLVGDACELVRRDSLVGKVPDDARPLRDGGNGSSAYAEAVAVYLACVVDRMAYYGSSMTTWLPKDNALRDCMPRQALAMAWDFAEGNPLGKSSGDVITCSNSVASFLDLATPERAAWVSQGDAQSSASLPRNCVVSTDPPYYDNIGYADLSDFFYVWLRRSLSAVYPDLFATLAVPKAEELVALGYRHEDKKTAEEFFLDGMTAAISRLAEKAHPAYPLTIYYAFRQAESRRDEGVASTGWETFLEAVIRAGLSITGTVPLRTEGAGRMVGMGTNVLASSIVLVCRHRTAEVSAATRREFVASLKAELPQALAHLQGGNIAPVDLAQAAIGPGMAIYTRYTNVRDAEGKPLTVRDALALINQTLDEALAEQEGDFDADTRWALTWFEQSGFAEGDYGVAEQLSKSKNTSVAGMEAAGILDSKRGKVRLLRPEELAADWDPATDLRLPAWEVVHWLVRALEEDGEAGAAALVAKIGSRVEIARELAYRLYNLCERKKWAKEALSYNALVQAWPEIMRLSHEVIASQGAMFGDNA